MCGNPIYKDKNGEVYLKEFISKMFLRMFEWSWFSKLSPSGKLESRNKPNKKEREVGQATRVVFEGESIE